jgi:hypothetical protein
MLPSDAPHASNMRSQKNSKEKSKDRHWNGRLGPVSDGPEERLKATSCSGCRFEALCRPVYAAKVLARSHGIEERACCMSAPRPSAVSHRGPAHRAACGCRSSCQSLQASK